MYLDDVAIRIVEEDLVPTVHRALTPVGIGDALCLEMCLEGGEVVSSVGDMPARDRIDDQPGAEPGIYIPCCQVHLDRPVGDESHVT